MRNRFHSAKRLAMHLRASLKCRGVLAALGLRSREWDYGLTRGKKLPTDEMILCPERKAKPSKVQPVQQTAWEEFPHLGEVRSLMDWLSLRGRGDDVQLARDGLQIISGHPLHLSFQVGPHPQCRRAKGRTCLHTGNGV